METIHIGSWQDLTPFGINALTGEACKFARRLLCDLNEDGSALIMDYLGVTMLQANWNSTVNDKPAVASVMLHRESLIQVAEFALLRSDDIKAIVYKGREAVMGIYTHHMLDQYRKLVEDWPETTNKWSMITVQRSTQRSEGSRNVHAFTGRTV